MPTYKYVSLHDMTRKLGIIVFGKELCKTGLTNLVIQSGLDFAIPLIFAEFTQFHR
jgi:hypothetical protein